MFSAVPQKNNEAAKSYFREHLTHNDYYSEGEVEPGRWLGLGAKRLGLKEGEPVLNEDFLALCEGLNPLTKKRLTLRLNKTGNRRIFHDFTCSAPKSISILAVTMDDQRLVQAHQEASRIAARELERFAATRIRVKGADGDRTTGNFLAAEFLHNSSRACDPHLHTHFTLINATFDQVEERWKALQTSGIFAACTYGTEVYRNELALRLRSIGYEIEPREKGFEVKGVSQELLKKFSKRAAQRDEAVANMEERLGRKLSNNEISVAVHRTRTRKLRGITSEEVRRMQTNQMTVVEILALRWLVAQAKNDRHPHLPDVDEAAALDFAVKHVFERACVAREEEILRLALIHGRGMVSLEKLKERIGSSTELVRVGAELTTREILQKELRLIDILDRSRNSLPPLSAHCVSSNRLGSDQRAALLHVLCSPDQFTGFRGLAGAGKTTALRELGAELERVGRHSVYCAPTTAATDVLRKDGFEDAITLKSLLIDSRRRKDLPPGSVIVVDEAGLIGLDDMAELFALAVETGARIVLSGDSGQHSAVARGDALRLLERHSLYRYGQLDQIRRQQGADYRKVVELAAAKRSREAFDRLDDLGWVLEPDDLHDAAAAAYILARERGESALLIAPTWREIEAVTRCVRASLRESGSLGREEVLMMVFDPCSWTTAQKLHPAQYRPGQIILFPQKSGSFNQHEQVEVVTVEGSRLKVRRANGKEVVFKPRNGTLFEVGERRQIRVAPGDRLLLRASRRTEGLVGGACVTVRSIDKGVIRLTNGTELPANYSQFCHGYCVTSHSAQGKTVDTAFLVASSHSGPAVHQEQFYVSVSRARMQCRVFTDDKESLRERICRSSQRAAAVDLLQDALARHGFGSRTVRARPQKKSSRRLRTGIQAFLRDRSFGRRVAAASQRVFGTLCYWSRHLREDLVPVLPQKRSVPIVTRAVKSDGPTLDI